MAKKPALKVHCPDGFEAHDISVESKRGYVFNGIELEIVEPKTLFLKRDERGDSHRIVTKDGRTYYPARGWLGIWWENHDTNRPVEF